MNIILLEHIDKVGERHDVVKVKDGYGRNYLLPKGLAIVANKTNLARLEGLKKQAAKELDRAKLTKGCIDLALSLKQEDEDRAAQAEDDNQPSLLD